MSHYRTNGKVRTKSRATALSIVADGDKSVYAGMLRPEIAAKVYPGIARVQINPPQKGVRPQTTPEKVEKLEVERVRP